MPAEWLIYVFLAQKDKIALLTETMRMSCGRTAFYADCVNFLYVFGNGHERRHWTERLAKKVHIQAGYYDAYAVVCQGCNHINNSLVKELGLIYADDFCSVIQTFKHQLRFIDWSALNVVGIVRNDFVLGVADIDAGFVYMDFLVGKLCTAKPSDEFFRFT